MVTYRYEKLIEKLYYCNNRSRLQHLAECYFYLGNSIEIVLEFKNIFHEIIIISANKHCTPFTDNQNLI